MVLKRWRTSGFGCVLVGLSVLLAGCATIPPDERPEITLTGLSIKDATMFETAVEATIRLTNPSLNSVDIEGATFKLVLDGRKVGRGMMRERFTIDGLDTRTATADFYVNNASALLKLRNILEQKAFDYGMIGNLYVAQGAGTTKIRVERFGRLSLHDVAAVTAGSETR